MVLELFLGPTVGKLESWMNSLYKQQHNGTGGRYNFPVAMDLRLWIGHLGVFTVRENETGGRWELQADVRCERKHKLLASL